MEDFIVMFVSMFIAGLLSTMNMWVTNYRDIRFSLNDIYMTLLMCGWMFFFMGHITSIRHPHYLAYH
jgi:hypothetical protein